jgi:hypothetical protein
MIEAFSVSILPFLRHAHTKVHLNEPSNDLLELICEYLDPTQIASLRIGSNRLKGIRELSSLNIFDQLVSLCVSFTPMLENLGHLHEYFPNGRILTLMFSSPFSSRLLHRLEVVTSMPITHLEIRCPGVFVDLSHFFVWNNTFPKNTTITSFTFHSESFALQSQTFLGVRRPRFMYFLDVVIMFSRSLINVQRVRIIMQNEQLYAEWNVNRWQQLISECVHLERVIIQIVGRADCTKRVKKIEEELRHLRPGLIVRIVNLKLD